MANEKIHHYRTQVLWTGNLGQGTASYRAYERSHEIVGRVLDLWIGDNRRKSNRESETYGSRISFVPRLSEY